METIDFKSSNTLIAKFMGLDDIVEYNVSWEYIMPVIHRIENDTFEEFRVVIFEEECTIWQKTINGVLLEKFIEISSRDCEFEKIQSVYVAIVEFIKWYNTNY